MQVKVIAAAREARRTLVLMGTTPEVLGLSRRLANRGPPPQGLFYVSYQGGENDPSVAREKLPARRGAEV